MGSLYNLFNENIDSLALYIQEKAEENLSKAVIKKMDADNDITQIIADYQTIAFETGFVLGQMFDIENSEVKACIKAIMEEMREKRAFPIFPRQHNKGKRTLNRPIAERR